MVALGEGAVSYERGTPADPNSGQLGRLKINRRNSINYLLLGIENYYN